MPKTVILIDDDQDDLDIIKETILSIDNTILCISFVYPEEALRVITKELVFTPDYIVCDINMPKIPGDVLLSRLRNTHGMQHTVIAMLSTSIQPAQSKKMLDGGADFTLQKPMKLADYRTMLTNVLAATRHPSTHVHELPGQKSFNDLRLNDLARETAAVYIIDYSWNYLFANPAATAKVEGYNMVGKNITEVWKELPQFNFQPVYALLKDNVNNRKPMELQQRSPLSGSVIKITGKPLSDCYLFNISEAGPDNGTT